MTERRERLSVRETRTALIDAGCEMFLEPRTDWGLGQISLGDAIARSDVSRASAYRAFSDDDVDPQNAFRLAVLLEVIARTVIDTSVVGEVLSSLGADEYGTDPVGQAAELREIIRRWSLLGQQSNIDNDHVRAVDVTRAVIGLSSQPDPEILAAIRHSNERSQAAFRPYFEALAERYGLRPRSWTSLEQVQSLFIATTAMAMIEWTIDDTTRSFSRPTGPGGELQDWSLSGMMIESLCLISFESDPAADSSADLTSWLP